MKKIERTNLTWHQYRKAIRGRRGMAPKTRESVILDSGPKKRS